MKQITNGNQGTRTLSLLGALCTLVMLAGGQAQATNSGFLPDYSRLEDSKDANGAPLRRWLSPKLTKANYEKMIIDKVSYYPTPKASEQVSDQALQDIQDHIDTQLRTVVLAEVPQATDPGPGILRLKVAITAAETTATGLKPWQVIPMALVVQGAEAATGKRKRNVVLAIESLVTDSVTNEVLSEAVRNVRGVTLPDSKAQLTLDVVKSRIDEWAAAMAQMVQRRSD
jgi:hypothetical protein